MVLQLQINQMYDNIAVISSSLQFFIHSFILFILPFYLMYSI